MCWNSCTFCPFFSPKGPLKSVLKKGHYGWQFYAPVDIFRFYCNTLLYRVRMLFERKPEFKRIWKKNCLNFLVKDVCKGNQNLPFLSLWDQHIFLPLVSEYSVWESQSFRIWMHWQISSRQSQQSLKKKGLFLRVKEKFSTSSSLFRF